jgi:flagellar biosynthetic protein FlhB
MADQEMDRSQPASPYKLQKAREKGQVAKSTDVVSVTVLAIAVIYLHWRGWGNIRENFEFDRALLLFAGRIDLNDAVFWHLAGHMAWHFIALLGPLFIALMLAAAAANLLQCGAVLSFHAVKPDWERINPANGIKRVFSLQLLFNALRSCLKLLFLVLVVYFSLKNISKQQFFGLAEMSATGYLKTALAKLASLGMNMVLLLAGIAALDLVFSKRQFAKKMRMSRRELRDEIKNREGDPRIRSRLRQLRREMVRRSQAVQNTRNADVLITNPTHLAIALRYVHGEMESPQLVAKGAGALAGVMRRVARNNNIPVVENRPLARKLFREVDLEQHVPPSLYAEVARIIVWVFALRKARGTPASSPHAGAAAGGRP